MITFVRRLSQPLRTLYVLWPVAVVGSVAAFLLGAPDAAVLVPVGTVAVLTGLALVTDLNRAAGTLAAAVAEHRPMGVDYSRSWMATPGCARLFGALMVVVGGGFLVAAFTSA